MELGQCAKKAKWPGETSQVQGGQWGAVRGQASRTLAGQGQEAVSRGLWDYGLSSVAQARQWEVALCDPSNVGSRRWGEARRGQTDLSEGS